MGKTTFGFGVVALAFGVGCGGAPAAKSAAGVTWSYEGEQGPANWGTLDPAFAACGRAGRGSRPSICRRTSRGRPRGRRPARPTRRCRSPSPTTRHFVLINDPAPSSFVFEGTTYALAQFHFHTPNEHTIDGRKYDAPRSHPSCTKSPGRQDAGDRGPLPARQRRTSCSARCGTRPPFRLARNPTTPPAPPSTSTSSSPRSPRYMRYDGSLTGPSVRRRDHVARRGARPGLPHDDLRRPDQAAALNSAWPERPGPSNLPWRA